jgi:hypothetical protein
MVVPVMAGFAGGIGQAIIKYKKDPSGSILWENLHHKTLKN